MHVHMVGNDWLRAKEKNGYWLLICSLSSKGKNAE